MKISLLIKLSLLRYTYFSSKAASPPLTIFALSEKSVGSNTALASSLLTVSAELSTSTGCMLFFVTTVVTVSTKEVSFFSVSVVVSPELSGRLLIASVVPDDTSLSFGALTMLLIPKPILKAAYKAVTASKTLTIFPLLLTLSSCESFVFFIFSPIVTLPYIFIKLRLLLFSDTFLCYRIVLIYCFARCY